MSILVAAGANNVASWPCRAINALVQGTVRVAETVPVPFVSQTYVVLTPSYPGFWVGTVEAPRATGISNLPVSLVVVLEAGVPGGDALAAGIQVNLRPALIQNARHYPLLPESLAP